MSDVWGNVAETLAEGAIEAGNDGKEYAFTESKEFFSHTINGYYDAYTLEN